MNTKALINIFFLKLFLTFCIISATSTVQAALVTWTLTAQIDEISDGFTPPGNLQIGDVFSVDYLIELDSPVSQQSNDGPNFFSAVESVTFNSEETFIGGGHIFPRNLAGINLNVPEALRNDGLSFISLGISSAGDGSSIDNLSDGLDFISDSINDSSFGFLRLDFDHISPGTELRADPLSFEVSEVPIPPSFLLLSSALIGLSCLRRSKNREN